jgi:hypothetical protein
MICKQNPPKLGIDILNLLLKSDRKEFNHVILAVVKGMSENGEDLDDDTLRLLWDRFKNGEMVYATA